MQRAFHRGLRRLAGEATAFSKLDRETEEVVANYK